MGGSSKSSKSSQVQAPSFDTTGHVNTGYNQTPSPFTAQGKPSWMQGHFANDMWGKAAADPRISLTQDMMNPYGAPILNEAVKQMGQYDQQMAMANAGQGQAPQMPSWMTQPGGGQPMSLEQAMAMNSRPQQIQMAGMSAPRAGKASEDRLPNGDYASGERFQGA